ncbi:helix-turn-helix domain-containing protein [Actinomadura parmotrematis]|uniref:Helix-turn-helix transcriptional regulator n=1 Tax=Actinomadura parmotrematis TaxID=2864039 RepID=A0ABS7G1V7_9ACTN|nr:helix-turn-helix transcriptional regulator [Actinomadura parmotrematis]MBW8486695.1 helix-turn-helix transcriptional regulator [Actinomadura parmotrematis]
MLSTTVLAASPDFTVTAVRCAGGHAGWSEPEPARGYALVLVRSGWFRLRSRGGGAIAEPASGYLQRPGDELRFAHPAGGDTCTAVNLSEALWHDTTDGGDHAAGLPLRVDGRTELAHRALLRAAPDAAFAMAEHLVGLLAGAACHGPAGTGTPAHRALAGAAREALLTGAPAAAGLVPLARALGVSPAHLSRVFRRETGTTLTRYRNRLRVSRALDRIGSGETDLAALAADLGFADQAHLTRTVRRETGGPPGRLRALLAPADPRR